MNFWMLTAIFLHTGGMLAFGGGLLWFVLVFAWSDRASGLEAQRVADGAFRVTSLAMSVGLTCLIGGGLLRHYLAHDGFNWSVSSPYETIGLLKILLFTAEWVAWGWFEVVTMHVFRRDAPQPDQQPTSEYIQARARVQRGLRLQLAMFAGVLLLGAAAQAAR